MKVCPNCKRHCANDAKYCVSCKTNIEKQPIVKEGKLHKKVSTGVGCLVIVIAALVIIFLVMMIPGSILSPSSHSSFGEGLFPFFGRNKVETSIRQMPFSDYDLFHKT